MSIYNFTEMHKFEKLEFEIGYSYDLYDADESVLITCSFILPEFKLQVPLVLNSEPVGEAIHKLKALTLNPTFIDYLNVVKNRATSFNIIKAETLINSDEWINYTKVKYSVLNEAIRIDNHLYKDTSPQITMYVEEQNNTIAKWELKKKQ
jgi:hypothetical protein